MNFQLLVLEMDLPQLHGRRKSASWSNLLRQNNCLWMGPVRSFPAYYTCLPSTHRAADGIFPETLRNEVVDILYVVFGLQPSVI
jgi:hypothetical protein